MDILVPLVIGIFGALASAYMSGKIISFAHYRQAQKQASETEARRLLNLFQALQAELTQVWQRYMAMVGEAVEKGKEAEELTFAGFFYSSQTYFSVYDNSAQLLGMLDPDSCRKIIETYVNLKAFFDELNQLNLSLDKQRQVRLQPNINLYESRQVREDLERYYDYLKKRHQQVKGLYLSTLEMLKEFVTLGQQARTKVEIKI